MNPKDVVWRFWKIMGGNDFFATTELLHKDFVLEGFNPVSDFAAG